MKNIKSILFIAVAGLVLLSCDKSLLDVPNENNPDFRKVYAKGDDVENVAAGIYNTLYKSEHGWSQPGIKMMFAVAADNVTCSHGNFGMWHASSEPRDLAWDNSPAYSNANQPQWNYDRSYAAIATANNVIKAIQGGVDIGPNGANNDRVMAVARMIQGIAYGNLALSFDRAHIVDEERTAEGVLDAASTYKEVAEAAVGYLEQALTHANTTFTIPAHWFASEGVLTNTDLAKRIHTSIARILAYLPRNKAELAQVDWNKVKTHADAGITSDWTVVADDANWYDLGGYYLTLNGWGKTDMYTIHMMDPANQPQHWPDVASFTAPPASTNPLDKRLLSDFEYQGSNSFQPARGYFNFSNYRFKRHDAHYATFIGPKAHILKAENDMLRAEARAYTGDAAGAAAIINAGTRVTRGQMPAVAANQADVIKAIHHERFVEMYNTSAGLQFYEMRKLDLLQKGTPLHFPVPAGTLQIFGESLPFYTFGTVAKADGINTSNGGWR
jgi:hypothetical protein